MNAPIEFETQRLLLGQWKAADREPFAALNADPIVMAHFPAPLTREESDAVADRCERLIAERRWGAWAAEIKATGAFIGFVGLHTPQDDLPICPYRPALRFCGDWHKRTGVKASPLKPPEALCTLASRC
jgi:RimJ/RimL family protein N-acetyltransferase